VPAASRPADSESTGAAAYRLLTCGFTGLDMIWPLGLIIQAITSEDDQEIRDCPAILKATHAGTGFMHESFHKDAPSRFTRKWFAWANTMFGELILKLHSHRPSLLRA
jgi:meiotically up-regulated gene 157 (Mug157) protein